MQKTSGGQGFADVWQRGHFAWEYKGKHKNLAAAYQQLLKYREDLENPPLLVVCDLNRFEVHTNFTGTAKQVYAFTLADLAGPEPLPSTTLSALEVLRALFSDPEKLRPHQTTSQVTEKAASNFALLAKSLRQYGADPEHAAHFLMRLLFCLFAEDVDLLPNRMFNKLVEATRHRPAEFAKRLSVLFSAMATGGSFGFDDIAHFNGGLFADGGVLDFASDDMEILSKACKLDWASVEPSIFGTLFERGLDPSKRSQLGAHYTSKDDILLIVEPVLMAPLRREWAEVQRQAQVIIVKIEAARGPARSRHQDSLRKLLVGFSSRIASVRVLDPACGSGNFLYVALKLLLDLEKEVIIFAFKNGLSAFFPQVAPEQLYGIEVNPYAHELAQIVVWIGYIQWLRDNGFGLSYSPILRPLHNIRRMDAILAYDEQGKPREPEWPSADVIIGNPPFLGGKRLRDVLSDRYVDDIFALYDGSVSRESDLVCYWFERARQLIGGSQTSRVGLLATNSIRGGANRRVLARIKESGDIFMAWSDRPWVLDGAAVRVSMIGFDNGAEKRRVLNGSTTLTINADLTGTLDLTSVKRLVENMNIAYMGDTKGGAFDIPPDVALKMINAPLNPNGRFNSDVVRPSVNGLDITRRPRGMWIVDFGIDMTEAMAALY
ncbi:MAG: class I SAM-dependent DNA methyltransferase, partial [Dehalococcoidia bacterium]|nr:class I SAM-dependent DNA methyltransferase [Dehalococcoidia bacterium]